MAEAGTLARLMPWKPSQPAMKSQAISEAGKSISYLQGQIEKTRIAEMQQIFYQLIESQTKTVMLAEVRDEYVFRGGDPAVVQEEEAKPKRVLICVLGILLGSMLGVFFVFIRHFIKNNNS